MNTTIKHNENGFSALRGKAKSILSAIDLPSTKDEEWKYTRVGKLGKKSFVIQNNKTITNVSHTIYPEADTRLVFENGFFREELSTNSSTLVKRIATLSDKELSDALARTGYIKEGYFTSYNDAFFTDGVLIDIPKNAKNQGIIELVYISTGSEQATVIKNIVLAEEGSETEIVMQFITENAHENLVNNALHVVVEPEAKLTFYKIQDEKTGVHHFSSENIIQHNNSSFNIHTIVLNGDFVRNDLNIKVNGTNCYSHLGGIFIATGTMHVDNHTLVDHQMPNCESNEQYKGIAHNNGTGVFNGKIFVRRDAQKINAYQNSANILLSDDANIYTKPELEIYADDVKCSHGTTTGCLDENALFYLRARGIGEESSRRLLVQAFATDVLEKIENAMVHNWVLQKLEEKLEHV